MTVKSRLLQLLEENKGRILSGERIAEELHCTRAAVWKAVKSLREEGYTIHAGSNKGYMLSPDNNRLSVEGIRPYLENPGVSVTVYKEVDSTNRAAKQAVVNGEAGHGSFVLAQRQSAGRGRRGRSFFSPEDAGLYLSVVLELSETLRDGLLITTAAATAVYKAVEKVCGISLDIKWVNDLYYRGKKVCGILTEAVTDFESGNIESAIVGIGLNLYWEPETLPGELAQVVGALFEDREEARHMDRNQLAAEIVNQLLGGVKNLKLSREYVEHNIVPGKEICILEKGRSRRAKALSIREDGGLVVQEEDGSETVLFYGEVSVQVESE